MTVAFIDTDGAELQGKTAPVRFTYSETLHRIDVVFASGKAEIAYRSGAFTSQYGDSADVFGTVTVYRRQGWPEHFQILITEDES
jgi:hypothetical protein